MHSGGQENPNKLFDCVKKVKEKNIKISKCHCIKLKAQPHLLFWASHHKKRYRTKTRGQRRTGEKLSWTWKESIKKEIWNVRELFRLRELMHKREELYEIIKRESPIPISSSHKTANNRAFHKATTFFKFFYIPFCTVQHQPVALTVRG